MCQHTNVYKAVFCGIIFSMKNVSFADFEKLDIRIGTVVKAEVPEWSHWVMRLVVDFGSETGEKTVFAGMMKWFKAEDFVGKQFPFVTNIEPKKIGPEGDFSEAMMLTASVAGESDKEEDERPVLFNLNEKVPSGAHVR